MFCLNICFNGVQSINQKVIVLPSKINEQVGRLSDINALRYGLLYAEMPQRLAWTSC